MRISSHHLPGLVDAPVSTAPVGAGAVQIEHAALTPELLGRALDAALSARARSLARRTVADVIAVIARLGAHWRDPESPWRQQALDALPAVTGLSPAMIAHTLPHLFEPYTAGELDAFVRAETGDPLALDGIVSTPWGGRHAIGPKLVAYVGAGNVPGLALPVLITALLAKAAVVVKPGAGEPVLAALIARSLASLDPALGACVAVAYWPGGTRALDDTVLSRADVVIVEGDDDAIAAVRASARGRVLGFGRRLSLAVVSREATARPLEVAAAIARDVSLYDQRGCLSPQVVYVETGGTVAPAGLAAHLGDALVALARGLPCGSLTLEERAALRALRQDAEWRGIGGGDVRVFGDASALGPTVVYDADPRFEPTCLNRSVRVKPLDRLEDLLLHLGSWAGSIEAIGAAGPPERLGGLALEWARGSSLSRVCPIGRMQHPPAAWRHGGLPRLGALLRWVDIEGQQEER
jgi:hypothetical protein